MPESPRPGPESNPDAAPQAAPELNPDAEPAEGETADARESPPRRPLRPRWVVAVALSVILLFGSLVGMLLRRPRGDKPGAQASKSGPQASKGTPASRKAAQTPATAPSPTRKSNPPPVAALPSPISAAPAEPEPIEQPTLASDTPPPPTSSLEASPGVMELAETSPVDAPTPLGEQLDLPAAAPETLPDLPAPAAEDIVASIPGAPTSPADDLPPTPLGSLERPEPVPAAPHPAETPPAMASRPPSLPSLAPTPDTAPAPDMGGPPPNGIPIPNAGRRALKVERPIGPPRAPTREPARRTARSSTPPPIDRVEPVRHVVQSGENYFTIARHYYGTGRFWKALAQANAQLTPDPAKLHVGDAIKVPPPEQLDPALIEPPTAVAEGPRRDAEAKRAAQAGAGGVLLPVGRPSRPAERAELEPERPAPTHTVRSRETLRTIARDRLGDSRRESEILELNLDRIASPADLRPGIRLRLPADADETVIR